MRRLLPLIAVALVTACAPPPGQFTARQAPAASPSAAPSPLPARPAPADLPRINYWEPAHGFPHDATPESLASIADGLHPRKTLAVYDAPGGRPRAFLPRSISGLPVVVPVVERRDGWVAILLPSVNRRIGWLPATGWEPRPLRDQVIVDLSDHRLTWLRDGRPHGAWTVAVGSSRTPTPLGRTFVLGRTTTHGHVYAGLDALVLGAVPDDKEALAASLQQGHTAIHGWSRRSAFGRSISNGCIRMPAEAQRVLLSHLETGSVVHVVR
ncbi:L,D-transpeptidase [Actinoplanes bogorensis]|uniref:L,D-transpeptidase n=1 Tax=Paractinoplanes bogorensis TaxID=1610840 RepID=A0ABS5YRF4_9ACTN|nr:L,D-transpeptidase [Actinoplanes bogorensis]MBU2665926.1 L,D-transpeptidase [Actinoplanes bogorensis]